MNKHQSDCDLEGLFHIYSAALSSLTVFGVKDLWKCSFCILPLSRFLRFTDILIQVFLVRHTSRLQNVFIVQDQTAQNLTFIWSFGDAEGVFWFLSGWVSPHTCVLAVKVPAECVDWSSYFWLALMMFILSRYNCYFAIFLVAFCAIGHTEECGRLWKRIFSYSCFYMFTPYR